MNKVQLVGRLTKDIEAVEFGEGKNKGYVARGSLAVRDGVDKNGDQIVQFINFVAWNTTANILEQYTKKGDVIAMCGRLVQNDYEDKDGVMHYSLQVTASEVELLPQSSKEEDKDRNSKRKTNKYHR